MIREKLGSSRLLKMSARTLSAFNLSGVSRFHSMQSEVKNDD